MIPLELQAIPPSATVYPGNSVTLLCSLRFVPTHEGEFSATWKHSGSPLNESLAGGQYRVLSSGGVSNLTLFTSHELNTAGTYTCETQGSPPSSVSIDVNVTLREYRLENIQFVWVQYSWLVLSDSYPCVGLCCMLAFLTSQ